MKPYYIKWQCCDIFVNMNLRSCAKTGKTLPKGKDIIQIVWYKSFAPVGS